MAQEYKFCLRVRQGRPQPFERGGSRVARALDCQETSPTTFRTKCSTACGLHLHDQAQAAAIAVVSPKDRRGEDQKRMRIRRAKSRVTSTKGDLHWLPSHETQPIILSRRELGGACLHAQPHALLRHAASKSSGPAGKYSSNSGRHAPFVLTHQP